MPSESSGDSKSRNAKRGDSEMSEPATRTTTVAETKSKTTIYAVIVADRHTDDEIELFFSKPRAIQRADEATTTMLEHFS